MDTISRPENRPDKLPTRRISRVWSVKEPAPDDFLAAVDKLGYGKFTAQLLYNRNLKTPEAIDYFFNASFPNLADPFLIKDMDKAVDRIKKALTAKECIAIYGDFDADGVTACSLLVQYFRAAGAEVVPRIPHRVDEGYGLNPSALRRLQAQGVKLIITVDCGVSNNAEVELATELGMDVIVTDHHRPPDVLPNALAILNVRQPGCNYPYKGLAGVGVAFHLVRALGKEGVKSNGLRPNDLLDLVALGTVADIAPLTGENRVLVSSGLKAMNKTTRPGIVALTEAASYKQGDLDTTSIGFGLAPRINAAGRIDDAILAYELLLTESLEKAREIALQLNQKNKERQGKLAQVLDEARGQVVSQRLAETQKLILLSGEEWPAGIVGLVAGRLADEYSRPVLVLERGPEFSKGSARSPYVFNIIEALSECADLLTRYGGHRQAAGFTIATANLPELESRLLAQAEVKLTEADLHPHLEIDMQLNLDEIEAAYSQSRVLAPFGSENSQPLYACYGLKLREARPVGTEGVHLRLKLFDVQRLKTVDAIFFREGWRAADLRPGDVLDIAFILEQNEWQGKKKVELHVRDIRTT
jgi:single-stranded-DNA-specific exonuclease